LQVVVKIKKDFLTPEKQREKSKSREKSEVKKSRNPDIGTYNPVA